jgi:serine O-acetyltransferase
MQKTINFNDLISEIKHDINDTAEVGFKRFIASYIYNLSFRVLLNYRIGKYLSSSQSKVLRFIASRYKIRQFTRYNCSISYNSIIGEGVRFAHPLGVVIGSGVVIKNHVTIWQQVTLGSTGRKNKELEYPIIGNNVKIYAGAKIIGGISIGENAIIGANAVVLQNVPDNCIAVGIPARIIDKRHI